MFKKKKLIILALSSSIFSIPAIVISCNQGKKDTNNRAQGNLKEKENFQESKKKIDFGYKELSSVFLVDFLKDLKTKTTLNDDDVIIKDIKPKTINNSENRVIIEITLHSNKFNKDYIFSKEFSGFRHISNGIDSISEQENSVTEVNDERNINFNLNWKFAKETSSNITSIKNNNFDENTLTNIDLPYDWSIYNDFSPNISNEWGALEGGNAWYRKTFEVKKEWKDKQVLIHFGGVYMDSEVYVNGALVGNYPSGYQEFTYDLSKFLNFDDPKNNVIALRAKNLIDSSRWYSGSGIYRDVTLSVKNKLHIDEYGVVITHKNLTKDNVKNIDSTAKYKIVNETNQKATFKIRQTIKTFSDEKVVKEITSSSFELEKGTSIEKNLDFKIDNVKLWDIKNPNLYTLTSEIIKVVDGREEIVDKDVQRYGYRFTNWTSNDGFSLNGKWLKLHGVSMHHDQGALGAVASYDAIYRQMKILKEMGVNAIRSTHNPSDQKLVHICEELGLLLIDEAFDTWYKGKKSQDYHRFFEQKSTHPKATNNQSWAEFDIKQMVRSKINSPAIFMWSIGNEIAESEEVKGTQTTQNLVKWVKEIDTTRYVTWGNDKYRFGNGQNKNVANASEKLDTVGMNYSENNAESLHKIHPDWKIYGSETSSAVKSRGIWYEPEKYDNGTNINSHYGKQQSDYGNNRVGWGKTATESWKFDRDNKWYAGQFIWTGFDYIGEPTPWHGKKGNDEPKSSYFGIVDTAGFPKMDYYLYQSQWLDVNEHPMVKIAPHWTWDDKTKRDFVIKNGKITLRIYSNARKVLLKVDGELLESKTFNVKETNYTNEKGEKIKYQEGENSNELYLKFEVDYEKYKNSTIVAEAYDENDKKVAVDTIKRADKPTKIKLIPEKTVVKADGTSLVYVHVLAIDDNGNENPFANNLINFNLKGQGKIVGVDNGDALSRERYKAQNDGSWKRKLFNGKALVIIQSTKTAGLIGLEASSTGLSSTSINLISSKNENTNIIPLGFENNNYVVLKNNELKLPKKLKVVYSDGKINETDVVLDSANVKTSTPGTYPIKVKVDGVELIFNVHVIDFEQTYYVEEIFNTIGVNDPIKLPQKVTLYSKFGSILEDVVWEDISKISTEKVTKKGGEVKIKGHLASHPQKEVNAYIRIIHKYEIYDINKQYVQIGKTTANASYQQGNDFAQNAIDGKIDHRKRWTNWSNSNNANDQKNDFTITLDQPQDVQAIGIHFFSDRNTHKDGPALIEISTSSDNQTFTPVTNQSNKDKFIANEETYENIISFNKVPKAKYIKLTITNRSKSSGTYYVTGFVELKVYGSSLLPIKDETRKLSEITVGLNQLSEFKPDVYKYSGSSEFIKGFPAVQFKQFQKDKSHLQTIIYDIDESHRVYKAILTSENGEKTVYEYEHTLMTDKIKKFKVIIDPIYVGSATKLMFDIELENGQKITAMDLNDFKIKLEDQSAENIYFNYKKDIIFAEHSTRDLKVFVEATYKGKKYISEPTTLNFIELPPKDKNIETASLYNLTIFKGEKINLPGYIDLKYPNELSKRKLLVRWQNVPQVATKTGFFIYEGETEEGQKVYSSIQVLEYIGVEDVTLATIQGFEPYQGLPENVMVIDSLGNKNVKSVKWEPFKENEFDKIGLIVKEGTIEGTNLKAKAHIRIALKDISKSINISKQVTGFNYPAAFASFTNDIDKASNDRISKINDATIETNSATQNKWSNWQNNASKRQKDSVGIIFARGGVIKPEMFDRVKIWFGEDSGTTVPTNYSFEYFDQEITNLPENEKLGHIDESSSNLKDNAKWKSIELKSKPIIKANDTNGTLFEFTRPIKATAIRITMDVPTNKNGIIIYEMQVDRLIPAENNDPLIEVKYDDKVYNEFNPDRFEYLVPDNKDLTKFIFTTNNNSKITSTLINQKLIVNVFSEDAKKLKTYIFKKQESIDLDKKALEVKKIISEIEHKYNTEIKYNLGKNSLYKAYIAQLNYLLELGSINQIDELIQKIKSI